MALGLHFANWRGVSGPQQLAMPKTKGYSNNSISANVTRAGKPQKKANK
jgi:hypothetical protein